ncbi:hypothetical protein GCM10011316_09650 [Roseibium aquae]|uniref:DUF2125 domain-containing protein n=1 Tax=Roseibium aquae TaxID=1323746 RepID=A0A916TDU8_9HYPH|nr:DUF2125 domain-containing protein [Roseibium aquae]GGB39708.1 hypothetical protein GCM10011316_09650 [Roseibium aquae]
MAANSSEPKKNLKIRYFGLMGAVVLGIAGWSGAWAYGRTVLAGELEAQIGHLADGGLHIQCADQAISGFPFRYEVRCSRLSAATPLGATAELGTVQAVALVYNPRHIIFESMGPADLRSPLTGESLTGQWQLARSSVKFSDNSVDQIDAIIEGPELALASPARELSVKAEKLGLHTRIVETSPGDAEIFLSADAVTSGESPEGLPPAGFRLHLRIPDGAGLMAGQPFVDLLRNADGGLPVELVLASLDAEPSRLEISGALILQPDGHLSGTLTVKVREIEALARYAGLFLPPDSALPRTLDSIARSLAQAARASDPDVGEVELPVVISNGSVRAGFLPLGQIPPVFPAGY